MSNNLLEAGAAFLLMSVASSVTDNFLSTNAQTALLSAKILDRNAFEHPNAGSPPGTTTFSPAAPGNLFLTQMLASISQGPQQQMMQAYGAQVNGMVEQAYQDYGYAKNDVSAALGAFLETAWEISTGTFKTETASPQDQEKTKVTIRQIQNALLASSGYKAMPDRNKQLLHETCTYLTGHLATQWMQSTSVPNLKAAVQETARKQLQTIFGISPDALTRHPDGIFVLNSVPAANVGKAETGVAVTNPGQETSVPNVNAKVAETQSIARVSEPSPATSINGTRIFIKYVFTGMTSRFDHLILFPDGAAFTDLPSKPVSQFDEATLRASLKPFDVGTWKETGDTIVLTFPDKKRDQVTTLRRVPRGWYDDDGEIDPDNSYNTYFPVIDITPEQILGAWHSKSLTTMGFAGGAMPMVAHGSDSDRVFNADGTFSGARTSYASATTANMGDAFRSGGDVGVYGTNDKKAAGRWRLDGPLLTLEIDGKRTVTPAFILPHWNNTGIAELLIDGDWWRRPEKDE